MVLIDPKGRSSGSSWRVPAGGLGRRELLIGGAALAAGVAAHADKEALAATSPDRGPLQAGDRFQIVKGELRDTFLRPEHLEIGAAPLEGFPFDPRTDVLRRKNRLNRVILLRLDPAEMDDATRERSTNGVLVYSALCTHRSCTIQSWKADERHVRCHCHLSEFAVLSEGSVKGGPARRQLPMVPLGQDGEGFVIARDGFNRRPGSDKI